LNDNPLLQANGLPAFAHIRPEHIEPAVLETIEASRAELEATDRNSQPVRSRL
jgi:Zn-dependent oligopeptidase